MAATSDIRVTATGGCLCGAVRYELLGDLRGNVHRGFCGECGSSLFWHPRGQERIAVAAGSLDDPIELQTIGHVWTSQLSEYYRIQDDLPQFEKGWTAITKSNAK